jgi:hypothetical protein
MKNLKTLLFVLAIPFFIFCTPQKTDNRQDKNVTTARLIGRWNQVNKLKSSEVSNPEVEYFQILNDSIVDIQIVDSNKRKKITGKWENGFNQKIGSTKITISGDIKITYDLTDNHRYILTLKLSEDNGKTIMSANKYKFEKEEN